MLGGNYGNVTIQELEWYEKKKRCDEYEEYIKSEDQKKQALKRGKEALKKQAADTKIQYNKKQEITLARKLALERANERSRRTISIPHPLPKSVTKMLREHEKKILTEKESKISNYEDIEELIPNIRKIQLIPANFDNKENALREEDNPQKLLIKKEQDELAKKRFYEALKKDRDNADYAKTLKQIENAEYANRRLLAKNVLDSGAGQVPCEYSDRLTKFEKQSTLENAVEKVYKNNNLKEHAIEDLEGYEDAWESRYTAPGDKVESLMVNSVPEFVKENYSHLLEKIVPTSRPKMTYTGWDISDDLNQAYIESPPQNCLPNTDDIDAIVRRRETRHAELTEMYEKKIKPMLEAQALFAECGTSDKSVEADIWKVPTEHKSVDASLHSEESLNQPVTSRCVQVDLMNSGLMAYKRSPATKYKSYFDNKFSRRDMQHQGEDSLSRPQNVDDDSSSTSYMSLHQNYGKPDIPINFNSSSSNSITHQEKPGTSNVCVPLSKSINNIVQTCDGKKSPVVLKNNEKEDNGRITKLKHYVKLAAEMCFNNEAMSKSKDLVPKRIDGSKPTAFQIEKVHLPSNALPCSVSGPTIPKSINLHPDNLQQKKMGEKYKNDYNSSENVSDVEVADPFIICNERQSIEKYVSPLDDNSFKEEYEFSKRKSAQLQPDYLRLSTIHEMDSALTNISCNSSKRISIEQYPNKTYPEIPISSYTSLLDIPDSDAIVQSKIIQLIPSPKDTPQLLTKPISSQSLQTPSFLDSSCNLTTPFRSQINLSLQSKQMPSSSSPCDIEMTVVESNKIVQYFKDVSSIKDNLPSTNLNVVEHDKKEKKSNSKENVLIPCLSTPSSLSDSSIEKAHNQNYSCKGLSNHPHVDPKHLSKRTYPDQICPITKDLQPQKQLHLNSKSSDVSTENSGASFKLMTPHSDKSNTDERLVDLKNLSVETNVKSDESDNSYIPMTPHSCVSRITSPKFSTQHQALKSLLTQNARNRSTSSCSLDNFENMTLHSYHSTFSQVIDQHSIKNNEIESKNNRSEFIHEVKHSSSSSEYPASVSENSDQDSSSNNYVNSKQSHMKKINYEGKSSVIHSKKPISAISVDEMSSSNILSSMHAGSINVDNSSIMSQPQSHKSVELNRYGHEKVSMSSNLKLDILSCTGNSKINDSDIGSFSNIPSSPISKYISNDEQNINALSEKYLQSPIKESSSKKCKDFKNELCNVEDSLKVKACSSKGFVPQSLCSGKLNTGSTSHPKNVNLQILEPHSPNLTSEFLKAAPYDANQIPNVYPLKKNSSKGFIPSSTISEGIKIPIKKDINQMDVKSDEMFEIKHPHGVVPELSPVLYTNQATESPNPILHALRKNFLSTQSGKWYSQMSSNNSTCNENIPAVLSFSKISFHSSSIKSLEKLIQENGILDEPDLTLFTSQVTINSDPPELVRNMSCMSSAIYSGNTLHDKPLDLMSGYIENLASFRSPLKLQSCPDSDLSTFPSVNISTAPESPSMLSFLRHEQSCIANSKYNVSSIIGKENIPETGLIQKWDDADSSLKTKRPTDSIVVCEKSDKSLEKLKNDALRKRTSPSDYKKRTLKLYNNLEEVQKKKLDENRRTMIAQNRLKMKEFSKKITPIKKI